MAAPKIAPPPADVFRIVISTDNHLGYGEKDPLRGNDSFTAFEEVLTISGELKTDILLLGGDLFHDNKPSREAVVKTMGLMRKHCMGDRPCVVDPVDVTAMALPGEAEPVVNYQDPNINISLPVFIIHGNHDDPCGQGQYSALDILSSAGLINYFGKQADVADIKIRPILLHKGNVRLAIYGLGNIRDERLVQTFKANKVTWLSPPDADSYFNILVLHQNRPSREARNSFPVEEIPEFINFVVWGHEHECISSVSKEGPNNVHILQPGSTAITSLTHGESAVKHCFYLDIKRPKEGEPYKYRDRKVAMHNMRTFVYEEVVLAGNCDGATEESVGEFLSESVRRLIEEAKEKRPCPDNLSKPLIRLKVEHTGFPPLHPLRFGSDFGAGQPVQKWLVANPQELLVFWRKSKARLGGAFQQARVDAADAGEEEEEEEVLEAPEIETLVKEELESAKEKGQMLQVLENNDLFSAVGDYVHRSDNKAISEMVDRRLLEVEKQFKKEVAEGKGMGDAENPEELAKHVLSALSERQKEKNKAAAKSGGGAPAGKGGPAVQKPPPGGKGRALADDLNKKGRQAAGDDDDDDDDDEDDFARSAVVPSKKAAPAKKAPAGRGAAASKGGAKAVGKGKRKEPEDAPSQTKLSFVRGAGKAKVGEEEEEEEGGGDGASGGAVVAPRQAGKRRAAAAKASYNEDNDEEDVEDEVEAFEARKQRKKARRADSDDD